MQHCRVKNPKSNFLGSNVLKACSTLMISSSKLFAMPFLHWWDWRVQKKDRLSTFKSGDLGDWVNSDMLHNPSVAAATNSGSFSAIWEDAPSCWITVFRFLQGRISQIAGMTFCIMNSLYRFLLTGRSFVSMWPQEQFLLARCADTLSTKGDIPILTLNVHSPWALKRGRATAERNITLSMWSFLAPSLRHNLVRSNVKAQVFLRNKRPLLIHMDRLVIIIIQRSYRINFGEAKRHTKNSCSAVNAGFRADVQGIITGSSLSHFIANTVDFGIPRAAARSLMVLLWKSGISFTGSRTLSWFHFLGLPHLYFWGLERNCRMSGFSKFSSARAQTLLIVRLHA